MQAVLIDYLVPFNYFLISVKFENNGGRGL